MRKLLVVIFSVITCNSYAQGTVKIGNQTWMNEDLKVGTFKDGGMINEATNNTEWNEFSKMEIPCFRRLSNGAYIYNGYAITDPRGIAPDGFRIATLKDFKLLFGFIGGLTNIKNSGKLTSYSFTTEDESPNGDLIDVKVIGKNIYGFNARMGGFCYGVSNESNADKGTCTFWWTSSENWINDEETQQQVPNLWGVSIGSCSQDLGGEMSYSLDYGFSVRCIKEAAKPQAPKVAVNSNKKLKHLYAANGGMIGYYSDGTIVECPRCDFVQSNINQMAREKPIGKYKELPDGRMDVDGSYERPDPKKDRSWVMVNYKWIKKAGQ